MSSVKRFVLPCIAALAVLCSGKPLRAADEQEVECRGRLEELGLAVGLYVRLNDGKLPSRLSDLYDAGLVSGLDQFCCPASGKRITQSSQIDVESDYVLAPRKASQVPMRLLWEKHAFHSGHALELYSDRSIKTFAAPSPPAPAKAAQPPPAGLPPASVPSVPVGPPEPVRRAPPAESAKERAAELIALSRKHWDAKQWKESERVALQALKLDPGPSGHHNMLGSTLYEQKRYREAEAAFRAAVRRNPKSARYRDNLANTLAKLGRYVEAEAAEGVAVRLAPNNVKYRKNHAYALHHLKKWREAETAYAALLRLAPKQASYHSGYGATLLEQDKYAPAAGAYRKAIELSPKTAIYHLYLAEALYLQNKLQPAVQCAKQARSLGNTTDKLYRTLANRCNEVGNQLHNQREPRRAHSYYLDATALQPNTGVFRANLASTFFQLGKLDTAREQARIAIRLGYKDHWVYARLGLSKK